MANAKQCDLCGEFYLQHDSPEVKVLASRKGYKEYSSIKPRITITFTENTDDPLIDLCINCKIKLFQESEWLNLKNK